MGIDEVRKYYNNKDGRNGKDNHRQSSRSVENSGLAEPKTESITDHEMAPLEIKQEEQEQIISIKGAAPIEVDTVTGPVTIEIENLDRETTAEDVKVNLSMLAWKAIAIYLSFSRLHIQVAN
jgi:hypothetical protein